MVPAPIAPRPPAPGPWPEPGPAPRAGPGGTPAPPGARPPALAHAPPALAPRGRHADLLDVMPFLKWAVVQEPLRLYDAGGFKEGDPFCQAVIGRN